MTLTFDLLTLKVVSESHVTLATSLLTLVFLGLSVLDLGPMYATVRRQTDRRQTDQCLIPRPRRAGGGGKGITNNLADEFARGGATGPI